MAVEAAELSPRNSQAEASVEPSPSTFCSDAGLTTSLCNCLTGSYNGGTTAQSTHGTWISCAGALEQSSCFMRISEFMLAGHWESVI